MISQSSKTAVLVKKNYFHLYIPCNHQQVSQRNSYNPSNTWRSCHLNKPHRSFDAVLSINSLLPLLGNSSQTTDAPNSLQKEHFFLRSYQIQRWHTMLRSVLLYEAYQLTNMGTCNGYLQHLVTC